MSHDVPNVTFKTRVRNDALGGPNPFEWKDLTSDEIFKGKNVVVFSLPGAFTPTCSTSHLPRYEELYEEFKNRLVIVGFPCNDFGGQEPGTNDEIMEFCTTNYNVSFPMAAKAGIKRNTHPIYEWLTNKAMNGVQDSTVQWNFHKFLLDEKGQLVHSLSSGVSPFDDIIMGWVTAP